MPFAAALSRPRLSALCAVAAIASLFVIAPAFAARSAGAGGGKADKTPPTISITAPSSGATVVGDLTVSGVAADSGGLARVEVSLDGGAPTVVSGTSSWTLTIDATAYSSGSHTLTARAVDKVGLSAVSSVTFTAAAEDVDTTPPTVSVASPSAGASVARQIVVSGSGSDDTMLARVEVRLDQGPYVMASGTTTWSSMVDAAGASDGQHVLTARATDGAGNATSTSVPVVITDGAVQAPTMEPGSIGGFVFQENDRDGVFETTEQPLAGVYVYVYDSTGVYLGNAQTDASGWYRFTALADGSYRVQIAPISWNTLRADWVPDTTGSVFPRMSVALSSQARADFGTRRILRSTDTAAPISSYVGPDGLEVESFNDAVTAQEVYDRIMGGTLIGAEARDVTIRLDITSGGITSSMMLERNGVPSEYHATSNVSWLGWLRGDGELFHEYGHAWSGFYAFMVQNDRTLTAYLEARGLAGDPRIDSSYSWKPGEMIAEDYCQLFGTASAQASAQSNRDIPLAKDVPGLRDFLSTTFRQPPAG